MGIRKKIWSWLSLRFGIEPIRREFLYHRVTRTPWYQGGGAALMLLFVVLIGTGVFLALTYSPSPATAYESVVQITSQDRLGWFVRGLHYWSAGMMIILLVWHVCRQVLLGGYLPPREGTWLIGVGLFFLTVINSYTGYSLRWDERAVYAIRIPLNIFYSFPWIGEEIVRFVQGGWEIGANTLSRYYAVHTLFVPFSMLALMGYHLYLVVLHGVTTGAEIEHPPATAEEQIEQYERLKESPEHGEEFHPRTSAKSGGFGMVALMIAVALTLILGPTELYPEANLVERSFPVEEWWFAWYSALAALLPPWLAPIFYVGFPIFLFLLMIFLPFIDRGENRGARRRPLAVTTVTLSLITIFALSALRVKSPWTAWPQEELPPLPPGTVLTGSASEGRRLFKEYGCTTCHAIGKHGPSFGPNLTGIDSRLSSNELRQLILEPPEDFAMPTYRGRISQEDLDKVVDFVLVAQTFPREFREELK